MKILKNTALFLLFITLTACATLSENTTLAGKWKLRETLADPGDGSGKWTPVSNESYITFYGNGRVTSTDSPEYQSYKTLDSSKIEFSLSDGKKQIMSYRMDGSFLILSPQCIEACGSKYAKVN